MNISISKGNIISRRYTMFMMNAKVTTEYSITFYSIFCSGRIIKVDYL